MYLTFDGRRLTEASFLLPSLPVPIMSSWIDPFERRQDPESRQEADLPWDGPGGDKS